MDKPVYHHLLIIIDWEIFDNEIFATYEEIEPALRALVTDYQQNLNFSDELVEEILSATDLSELREALEDQDVAVYLSTLTAP